MADQPTSTAVERTSSIPEEPVDQLDNDVELARESTSEDLEKSTSVEPKKCWICFCDSSEDEPGVTSPWRTPCPCALTAHEACLLDWIADLEAPPASSTQSRNRKDMIECPQCKAEIRVARPWSPIVAGVRVVERIGGTLVLPGIASLLMGGIFSACFVHGAVSMFLILGPDDWERLVGNVDGRGARAGIRVVLGLPTVPIALILSRTKLGDRIFPLLPLAWYGPELIARGEWHRLIDAAYPGTINTATSATHTFEAVAYWPPDVAMTISALPYLRAVYNAGYARLFASKEREWIKAVQRELRPGETDAQRDEAQVPEEGRVELQADIIFGNDGDDENDLAENQAQEIQNQADGDDDAEVAPEQENGENQVENMDVNANARQRRRREHRAPGQDQRQDRRQERQDNRQPQNNGLVLSASRILDNVLGALCFPAIASVMGEVLRLGLPARLTASSHLRRPGILHTKWGRSIVGGCLFVVMKDAILLYSRYRLAQDHKKRRVLDYNGPPVRSVE